MSPRGCLTSPEVSLSNRPPLADDLGKQHIATKRLRSDLDTRLSTLTKLTTSELERVHLELDRRLQQPGVHLERLEKRLEAEGRGREEQLEHICSELGIVQGLEDRLAKGLNDFEVRMPPQELIRITLYKDTVFLNTLRNVSTYYRCFLSITKMPQLLNDGGVM
jgi:hypothetical protein